MREKRKQQKRHRSVRVELKGEKKRAEKDVEGDHYFMLVVVSHAKRVKTRTKSGKATQDETIEKQEEEKNDRSIKGMRDKEE